MQWELFAILFCGLYFFFQFTFIRAEGTINKIAFRLIPMVMGIFLIIYAVAKLGYFSA